MFRLRIALGVASSLVAVAALTIIFAGRGEAQGNGNGNGLPSGPNVTVVNTPLPVTGNVTATLAGGGVVQAQQSGPWTVDLTPGTTIQDVNAPGLQPFRATSEFTINALNSQKLVTTVPAGKRLVIEYLSWYVGAANDIQVVFGALRNGRLGPLVALLEIHPPHPSGSVGFRIQDGSQPTRLYFEPGEEVWVSVTKSDASATGDNPSLTFAVSGYFISL